MEDTKRKGSDRDDEADARVDESIRTNRAVN